MLRISCFAPLPCFAALVLSVPSPAPAAEPRPSVLVVVGAAGAPEYAEPFRQWAARWQAAAETAQAEFAAIGLDEPPAGEKAALDDRARLAQRLAEIETAGPEPLWLVLIGHGTFDGKTAKLNLRGPDVTPAELAPWLAPFQRPLAILDCTSSSGPFLNELSGPNRTIVTATRSGFEYNFARLGEHLSAAITDPRADLDKDEQVSLLEAYLAAAARVREFYASESRLETEHALLDDNGDRLGTPADWFQGLRATKTAKDGAPLDGPRAAQLVLVRSQREERLTADQRSRRDALERDLAALRPRKAQLSEDEYLALLEPILIELARLYSQAETGADAAPSGQPK